MLEGVVIMTINWLGKKLTQVAYISIAISKVDIYLFPK